MGCSLMIAPFDFANHNKIAAGQFFDHLKVTPLGLPIEKTFVPMIVMLVLAVCTILLKNNFNPKAVSQLMGYAKEIIEDCLDDLQPFIDEVIPKEESESGTDFSGDNYSRTNQRISCMKLRYWHN